MVFGEDSDHNYSNNNLYYNNYVVVLVQVETLFYCAMLSTFSDAFLLNEWLKCISVQSIQ